MKIGTLTKQVGVVTVGVMLAGYIMYSLKDIALVADATKGFDS